MSAFARKALKNRFDPDNLFRINRNIPPTAG
ncbi:BBE domain-containing protein [Arthrobacter sp. Leaf141]